MKKVVIGIALILVVVFGGGATLVNTELGDYVEDELGIDLSFLEESEETNYADVEGYEIPEYVGDDVQVINGNEPYFTEDELDISKGSWESYSDLDNLGRVGQANALIDQDIMPTEDRESISSVTPTGFENQQVTINGSTQWLYNRSHLIGFQLTGENANEENLMTGTRTFNFPNMETIESEVAEYVKDTGNTVRYRVTPVFKEDELVARGVFMEGQSIEDNSIQFNVFIHNVEEGYEIDYKTGHLK